MQGHVLTRMQANIDFLTDQSEVALHALDFQGRKQGRVRRVGYIA